MSHSDLVLLGRVAVGIAVAFVFGFERQLRGSPAGDRTFSLVGAAATSVTAVAGLRSPQAVAGIMTGLGFIGAGVLLRRGQLVTGLTTAASIFAVAGIGIVVGYGHVLLGIVLGAILLLILEIQHIPFLRFLDARNYADRFQNDRAFPVSPGFPIGPPGGPGSTGPAEGTAGSDDR